MKRVIVYYSLSGNTRFAAEQIARRLGADLLPIAPEKAYPDRGFRKFFWGGKSAVMAETPALQPYAFAAEQYEQVIFGFPVWAGNVAPPLRTFVRDNLDSLRGKRLAAFACQSGSGAERAFSRLRDYLGGAALDAELILIDPQDKPAAENDARIARFCEACGE